MSKAVHGMVIDRLRAWERYALPPENLDGSYSCTFEGCTKYFWGVGKWR
jgi:hypothetical protein